MTIERAVVFGTLLGVVQTRHMFTCDVVPAGGDTDELLWTTYLDSIYTPVTAALSSGFATQQYELQSYSGGHWVPYDSVTFTHAGSGATNMLPNAVAMVLLGKASGLRHVGRKFFSGMEAAYVNLNSLSTSGLAVAASTLLAYITPFTGIGGGTITPGVVDSAGAFHAFVGGLVSTLLGSMRRRKPGLGI